MQCEQVKMHKMLFQAFYQLFTLLLHLRLCFEVNYGYCCLVESLSMPAFSIVYFLEPSVAYSNNNKSYIGFTSMTLCDIKIILPQKIYQLQLSYWNRVKRSHPKRDQNGLIQNGISLARYKAHAIMKVKITFATNVIAMIMFCLPPWCTTHLCLLSS